MKNKQKTAGTPVYVIDENFRIMYYNNNLKKMIPEIELHQYCYELFNKRNTQCQSCPLRPEAQGTTIRYNIRQNAWFNVTSAPIDYPGFGTGHVILLNQLEKDEKKYLYNAADSADYSELLELNYQNDTYNVAYHSVRHSAANTHAGSIKDMVAQVAENRIHPDDREHFYNFWLLNHVGQSGVPSELATSRHAEFRRLGSDGTYQWTQQLMIPVRQNSRNSIFVNNLFNVIDMPSTSEELTIPEETCRLYGKRQFFQQVDSLIRQSDSTEQWCMLAIDFEKFKLFNEWYGQEAGDLLLEDLSRYLKKQQDTIGGIGGYFDNDDFALFASYDKAQWHEIFKDITVLLKKHSDKMNILPAFGIYKITDNNIPAFKAYDRANLACESIKGNFSTRIKEFDHKMLQQLESEYLLLSDIQNAFKNKEFTFYLQPKCEMTSGKIIGAEALARWNSKDKGMIPPGVFIPFLEKSGFVAELDTYIWEEVCKWLRDRLDQGLPIQPVSVNVSRADLYSVDVPSYFLNLIKKYDLSPKMLEIEITESAYAESSSMISKVVKKLRDAGFHILMDDFGSAYSSLNMLKDISVDTLKIDMRFLDLNPDNTSKGIDILETVCNMAKILGLGVIVEGVETEEQKNYLLAMKCRYGQGYYFYRPLPIQDFEKIVESECNMCSEEISTENNEMFYLKDMLGKDIFSEIMLDNMLGAMVFYDVYDNEINIIRYNEQYRTLVGYPNGVTNNKARFGDQLFQEDYDKVIQMFEDAQNNRHKGAEVDIRRRRYDGTEIWIHLKTFFLHKQNGHAIYYSAANDVTKIHQANTALRFLNNDMPGGYYRHKNTEDCEFTHISQRFLNITGYTRQEIRVLFDDKLMYMIHPDDREAVKADIRSIKQHGGVYSQYYRLRTKHCYIYVVDQSRLVEYGGHEIFQGIILCGLDILFKDNPK